MRESRILCFACHCRLAASAGPRAAPLVRPRPPWSARAAFASAAGSERSASASASASDHRGGHQHGEDAGPPGQDAAERRPRISRERPRRPAPRGSGKHGANALAVFESVLKEQAAEKKDGGLPAEVSMELYNNLARFEQMIKTEDVPGCYRYLEASILPHLRGSVSVPRVVKERSCRFLSTVSRRRQEDFEDGGLPSVTQITRAFISLGGLDPLRWGPLIVGLTQYVCEMSTDPDDYSSIDRFENALARRELLLQDLVTAWKTFTHAGLPGVVYAKLDPNLEEFRLPRLDLGLRWSHDKATDVLHAVGTLFPQWKRHQLDDIVPGIIGTYVLLSTSPLSSAALRRDASTLVAAVRKVLEKTYLRRDTLRRMLEPYPGLQRYVLGQWDSIRGPGRAASAPEGKASDFIRLKVGEEAPPFSGHKIHKSLSEALRRRNLGELEGAWAEYWGDAAQPDEGRLRLLREHAELFDFFLMAYTAMRQPARARRVLQCMGRAGLEPTLKTYTSMLEGAKRARNAQAIAEIWRRITASRPRLDTAVWTARVSGLIQCGEPEAGLRALDEMARLWKAAARDGDAGAGAGAAVRPSIEPVNAAIAALFRVNGAAAAKKVLQWAVRQGIEPNVITYNTLLQPMIREGLLEEVDHVLRVMREQGVQADATTFTIVLEGALQQIGPGDTARQIETVGRVLEQMEQAGLEAQMVNYAKILHVLLREGDSAGESVKAVLAHMWAKNLKLSSPIYTILVEHYFARDPPDLAAVNDLIASRGLMDDPAIDRVFWERVIKGYALAGDTDSAFRAFERRDSGITLPTLTVLLRALVYRQQWREARKLVDIVVRQHRAQLPAAGAGAGAGDGPGAEPPRFLRHGFWAFAADNGLLAEGAVERQDAAGAEPPQT